MIKVKPINRSYKYGLVIEGHADYAEHGEDIVCSAVSVLTHMLITQLPRYGNVKTSATKGYTAIEIYTFSTALDVLIEAFLETVDNLQSQYPTYIVMEGI